MSAFIPITELKEGEQGVVAHIEGGSNLTSRLASMGIAANTRFRIAQISGGRIVVQVAGTRIALGHGEASKITVYKIELNESCLPPIEKEISVALVGQPNVGKSTVFNILTGLSQHVGNWPGKTIEKKEGVHRASNALIRLVDLPGTYSLTAFSEEERVARDYIIKEKPDMVVLVVNAASLERSLYLLSEILLLNRRVVVAVNMLDVAATHGIQIDSKSLQSALGLPVVPMVARRNSGIKELVDKIIEIAAGDDQFHPHLPEVSADHLQIYKTILAEVRPYVTEPYTAQWVAVKMMEGDPEVSAIVKEKAQDRTWAAIQEMLSRHEDALHAVVNGRYDWIENISRAAVSSFRMGQVVFTDRIDHVLTRPVFGIPILLTVMALVFFLTYSVGVPLQNWLAGLISEFSGFLEPFVIGWPLWIKGLLFSGIIGGAGTVITFTPVLIIFLR